MEQEKKKSFCPDCAGETKKFQAVVECLSCGSKFFIIKTSKGKRND